MTYSEYTHETLSQKQALFQLEQHGIIDPKEFFADLGRKDYYTGNAVLIWLGY